MDLLTSLGTAVWICGALALIARRIRGYQYDGLLAIAEGLFCLDALRTGDHLLAVFAAATCAYFAHRWWRGGGATVLDAVFVLCAASSPGCAVPRRSPRPDPGISLLTLYPRECSPS